MDALNDEKYRALQILTGSVDGQIDDLEVDWLQLQTGDTVITDVNDLWMLLWDQALIDPGQYNDRAFDWLGSLGFLADQLNDRWLEYWSSIQ